MATNEVSASPIPPDRSSSSLWSNCRPNIQRRINALLNLQADYFRLRVQFHREIQRFQCTYASQFEEILEQRRKIIDGSAEPVAQTSTAQPADLLSGGIPQFWLTVLKNVHTFDYAVQRRDDLCLQYLMDIRCRLQLTGFKLEFYFHPGNPYFTESILTKSYSIRIELDPTNPYRSFDGPEVDRCHGCAITWTPDHNLTVRKRHRRRRNKATGEIRVVQVEEPARSFFDFFSPPVIPSAGMNGMSDEDQIRLEADIEFGLLLKQRVVSRALLFYTGEAHENEDLSIESSQSSLFNAEGEQTTNSHEQ
jgi:nucleosome assembly protein 1-like 1